MKNKEEIIKSIKALHRELKTYKVREIGVFGSVVRGEQKQASDIDVLVDFEDNADLFDLVGLGLFLEEKLGQKVDVVPRRALRKEIRDSVLKEVVPA
ncbi:MAG: nucleotidyltransferase family protein [Nitrospirae bacterium]|nr:nucleotidyltransferase family protein [Nitrospirota bacterium]